MALKILYSTRTDDMVRDLIQALREGSDDPAALRTVLLPSRPLVERIEVALARRNGVAMGVEFLLPAAFIERVSRRLGLPDLHPSWSPEGMAWRSLELLGPLAARFPRLAPACGDARARLALARQVADRFDQYMHFRPDLIAAWDEGRTFNQRIKADPRLRDLFKDGLPAGALEDEEWQRALWDLLRSSLRNHRHPKARMDELYRLAQSGDLAGLAPSVEVLATGPLPYPLLALLREIGARMPVRLRVLMPSAAYLDGIRSKVQLWSAGEDEDLDAEAHPLLAQMGRQSIEAFKGLVGLSESGQEDEAAEEAEDGRPSLLNRLQDDIRRARRPDPSARPVEEEPLRSLRVHRCYGARREVEALRDELLRAFDDFKASGRELRLEDILILTPDLELYGPLVSAVLARGEAPQLPVALAELSLRQSDPVFKAVASLLELAAGRGALSDLTAFLELPALRARLGEDAAEALAGRLSASGITFGFDAGHRRQGLQAGASPTGTWRAGLDRLWAGVWLGEAPGAVDPAGAPLLPVAGDLGGGSQSLLEALDWCESLLATLLAWQAPAPPEAWARRLESAYASLIETPDPDFDPANLRSAVESLRAAGLEHGCLQALDASCVADQFRALDSEERRRVGPVGGRIALGGFKPLRALPCRVLAVLGLSDPAFPRRSQAPAWDLLAAKHMPGDRDPRKEDRQLFLDALLAAQDRVILTAPAKSQHTDKDEPMSVCLEELLRAAVETLLPEGAGEGARAEALGKLRISHPLQPFSPRNFQGIEASYDRRGRELAELLGRERVERPFAPSAPAPAVPGDAAPDLDALLAFFKDPARAWLRNLGLAAPTSQEDPADSDSEPIDLDALERWQLRDAVMVQVLGRGGAGEEPFLLERLAADRLLPLGRLGMSVGAEARDRARALKRDLVAAGGGEPVAHRVVARLRGADLWGTLHRAAGSKTGDGLPTLLWLTRDLERGGRDYKTSAVSMLDAWMRACLAAAAGDPRPLLVAGIEKKTLAPLLLRLPSPDPAEAPARLETLLKLRTRGLAGLLPSAPETSLALAGALGEGGDLREAAEDAWLGSEWGRPGEGLKPSNRLAWRGQDPFGPGRIRDWAETAAELWSPVLAWWSLARAPDTTAAAKGKA